MKVKLLSRVRLFTTPWTVAYQAPPPMGFSRQEYWSGVPLPSPDDHLVQLEKEEPHLPQSLIRMIGFHQSLLLSNFALLLALIII